MNILAVVPARGGSKSIPRKNICELGGKPLIAWTLEAAHSAGRLARVVVSTEDVEIARIAREWGGDVPFLRPEEFARDDTSHIEPVLHALDCIPEADWVMLLQPTSPLRTSGDIDGIVDYCRSKDAPAAVSVCEAFQHPAWMYTMDSEGRMERVLETPMAMRRQDLPPVFALNGALYLARVDWLRETRSFLSRETQAYVMPRHRSAEVDDEYDWRQVERLIGETLGNRGKHGDSAP